MVVALVSGVVAVFATLALTQAPALAKSVEGTLTSVLVKTAPVLDGNASDAVWTNATESKIGVRTFGSSTFKITLKSVYDGTNVYFLVQYPDSNKEANRGEWAYDASKKAWAVIPDDFGDEDEFGFFWNYNVPGYSKTGCLTLCHGDKMYTPKGTWADEWTWNASRTNPMGWGRDFRITDNPNADEAGGFAKDEGYKTNTGYKDNVQKLGTVEVPLYWKPYSGAGGISVGDPHYLLQSEIDAGLTKKIVKIDSDGTLVDRAGNKVPFFARIPGRILSAPAGPSWNDVKAEGIWQNNGMWTVEIARKLNTGHADDVQFEVGKEYYFDMYIKTRQPGEAAHAQVPVTKFVFAK